MRIVIQRVKSSAVIVEGKVISKIGRGLNLLVGISPTDADVELDWMCRKCLDLRLFPGDENSSRWEKSVSDIQGEILVVSQFTLYGDCRKGRRPSFINSASPEIAEKIYNRFVAKLQQSELYIASGQFGAMMEVHIENDGPVTLVLER
ncbi:MAG: D-aminoacyl-tRNA deacylase [Xenococcus sp. (in: cyanobacteria)]